MNMNINELFEYIQERFIPEDLSGEFQLHGNCIIWTFNLDNNVEELPNYPRHDDEDNDEEVLQFDFESLSSEEILQEAYDHNKEKIEEMLDLLDESDNWSFSESDINENVISFKIF